MSQKNLTRALLAAILLLGCQGRAPEGPRPAASQPAASQPVEPAMKKNKHPPAPVTYAEGPALTPSGPLLEWLNREGSAKPRRKLKLPVVVRFRDEHRLGL